jgi:diguanylate cyclase (GGDEF)-like protein
MGGNMVLLAATCYCISFACQFVAAFFSLRLIKATPTVYKWAWISLSLGLILMLGRRISPIVKIFETGHYNLSDALLAVPISGLLLAGVVGIQRLLLHTKDGYDLLITLSQFDPLTSALSKTEIIYKISQEIERSQRNGHSFALIEMDIDYFKVVNDTYGHQIGDEVLINLVRRAKEKLRAIDSLGRIGGEEFLILLPETDRQAAFDAAERIRVFIDESVYEAINFVDIHITISLGVVIFEPQACLSADKQEVLAELVRKADLAMYMAKDAGRNRTQMWVT